MQKMLRIILIAALCGISYAQIEGIYCGKMNCYDVLGVTRDDEKATIMRAYRKMARVMHPDRQRTEEGRAEAEIQFRALVTAYDILKDDEQREEYNYMLDNPEEMYYHYYQYFKRKYTKVDVRLAVAAIITIISAGQYYAQWSNYTGMVAEMVKQPRYRLKAKEIAMTEGLMDEPKKRENGRRITKEQVRSRQEKVIRTIIAEKMQIRTPYKKPTILRTLWFQLVLTPVWLIRCLFYWISWFVRYWVIRKDYSKSDKLAIVRRYLGESEEDWETVSEADKEFYLSRDLWKKENYEVYAEEQATLLRAKLAEDSKSKRQRRLLKNGGPGQIVFGPDDAPDFDY